jgi:radical SAM protein with 4Fe4S-binding SPASM domain
MSKYSEYRKKWSRKPHKQVIERVPIHLDLELTTYCNLTCEFCPRTQIGLKSMHMDVELAKRIILEFTEKGGLSVKLVYLGEPMLYPHLIEIAKYCKDLGILETIIATNGNLLNTTDLRELIKYLDFVIVSIDSSYPSIYHQIRKGGNLGKVIRGLSFLNTLKQLQDTDKPRIQIQGIPMALNQEEIDSGRYKDFWKYFADAVVISPYLEDYDNLDDLGITPKFICESPYKRMTVRVNGDISLCCGTRLDSKIIGNYETMNLEEAWHSKLFTKTRKKILEGKAHEIESCRICPFRKHEVK